MLNILGNQFKCKSLILLALYVSLFIIIYLQFSTKMAKDTEFSQISYESLPIFFKLKNLKNDEELLADKNFKKIFFIETHLDLIRKLDNPRQACSVESAGKI